MTNYSAKDVRKQALLDLGLDLPDLQFVHRDSLYTSQSATLHEVDRTPVVFDPDIGPGDGVVERCFPSVNGFDIGGKATTNDAGRLTWKLSDFTCDISSAIEEPASFVATAQSDSPVILTTKTVFAGNNLVIEVFSWNVDGNPAPNVRFAWRCWMMKSFE